MAVHDDPIQISMKGLAECATANPLQLRQLLRTFKYPTSDEGRARIVYYAEARDSVVAYHRGGLDREWLLAQAERLDAQAALVSGRPRARLEHNARALRKYHDRFGDRRFDEVLPVPKMALAHAGVRVSVVPDLRVRERGREKLVKVEFGLDPVGETEAKIMSEAMLQAAQAGGMSVAASGTLVFDVGRGRELRGARAGVRIRRLIQATCRNVALIWDSIENG